jgi:hypothetical protein
MRRTTTKPSINPESRLHDSGVRSLSLTLALTLTMLVSLISVSSSKAQLITSLADMGLSTFTIDEDATSLPYNQQSNFVNINTGFPLGATIGGIWNPAVPKDWSSYSLQDFGLMLSIDGANPNTPYTIDLYDSNLDLANKFSGSTDGVGSTATFSPLSFALAGSGQMDDIIGVVLTFDAPDAINMNWESIAVVPEPSTYILLGLGIVICGIALLNKRKKTS